MTPILPPTICGHCAAGVHAACTGKAIRWVAGRQVTVTCTCAHGGEDHLW